MYTASISVEDREGIIKKCFASEDHEIKNNSFKMLSQKEKVVFQIQAQNSTGLRTVLNSITKMLTVIEKMQDIK